MSLEDKKLTIDPPIKSSMEILSELFSKFDAEPPVIVKKEVEDESTKKLKKSKKKHKHKDRKHRKKLKKQKRPLSHSSDSSAVDLTDLLIKKEIENETVELNGTNLEEIIEESNIESGVTETDPKNTEEKAEETHDANNSKKNKIVIKDLKFSSIFDATILAIKEQEKLKHAPEDGELSQSDINSSGEKSAEDIERHRTKKEKHKKKYKRSKHDDEKSKKRKRSSGRSCSRERARKRSRSLSADSTKSKKLWEKSRVKVIHKERHKRKSSDQESKDECTTTAAYNRKSREKDVCKKQNRKHNEHRSKERQDCEDKKRKYSSFYRTDVYSEKEEKWFMKDRYRGYSDRDREREKRYRETLEDSTAHIDKKKLLEIARKNAIQMMKSGSLPGALALGPQAQEKVIAAIKSGGKTVEELTDFCKTLSKKEELGELSSVSEDNISDSDGEKPFHHPFQIKERPVSITMNIKNSVPLPIKNSQERASELRIQFPVSSGQQHRKTENEWIPVPPKKAETVVVKPTPTANYVAIPLPIEPPPPAVSSVSLPLSVPLATAPTHSVPQVFPSSTNAEQNIDIATIVSQRLSAMRKLQENPNDVKALNVMYKAQKEMNSWAESKQQIGQFTGSTGAQILSLAELSSGYQAWARKDQFQTAAPVSGGMGMHLLQKMGWRPGEGLGKEKTGALEPLLLEVKLDKKGIVAKEEQRKKQTKQQKPIPKTLQGKHPVSLLGEYASKHKLGAPQYDLCFECGPDHKKNFLFRVLLNGVEYKPQIASPNKKEAKANAALICLQQLGILLQP